MIEKKAIFLDMDDTTLNRQKQVPEANMKALQLALKAGHEVVVCTGRATSSAKALVERVGLDKIGIHYIISYNGCEVSDISNGNVLYSRTIPLELIYQIIDMGKEKGLYMQSYKDGMVISERFDENMDHYIRRTAMKYEVVPDLNKELIEAPCKVLAIDLHDRERLEAFRDELLAKMGEHIDAFLSCNEYLEIVPKGVNKGDAILAYCERVGVDYRNSIAVGDEENDLTMIKAAATGCAVANAIPAVKEAADYITERDCDHGAVAEVVFRFMLDGRGKE